VTRQDPVWVRWTLTAAALVFLCVMLVIPLAAVFIEAFAKGAGAYWRNITDPATLAALRLTLTAAAIAAPLNAAFGLAAAWAVTRFEFKGRSLLITLIDLPFAVSPVIAGLIYVAALGSRTPMGGWLAGMGIEVIFATPGIVLATLFVTFPFVARELIPLMQEQGSDDEQASVVLGAGVAGLNAAQIAHGMQARVLVLDKSVSRLRQVDLQFNGEIQTITSNAYEVEKACLEADLVIGAVLIPGAKAPRLVSNELVSRMKPGSVLVDISIDQGGCFEDSRPTTHADPTYKVHNSVFYCVANMPGAVPHTSTYALTNVTLPYAVALADKGWKQALRDDASLAKGLNVFNGRVTEAHVAEAHGMEHLPLADVLS